MKNEAIELIIFDLDGTLVDAYKAVASSLNYALESVAVAALTDEQIKRSVGWGDRNLVRRFVPVAKLEKTLSVYRKHHRKALKKGTKFLPGAKKVLFELKKQGYRLAIASNRPSPFVRIILKYLNVDCLFDYVLGGDQVKSPKPAPEMLKRILKRFSLKPAQALYVGDMTIDVETAHRAGVKSVAVLTGSSRLDEIAPLKPFKTIRRLEALFSVLKNND